MASSSPPPYHLMLAGDTRIWHISPHETEFLYIEIFTHRSYLQHGISIPAHSAVVIDVGANIGLFSLWISTLSAAPRIVAIEPSPLSYGALELNVPAASLYQIALGAERQSHIMFTSYPDEPGETTRYPSERDEMRAATLASLSIAPQETKEALIGHSAVLEQQHLQPQPEQFHCDVFTRSDTISAEELTHIDVLKGCYRIDLEWDLCHSFFITYISHKLIIYIYMYDNIIHCCC